MAAEELSSRKAVCIGTCRYSGAEQEEDTPWKPRGTKEDDSEETFKGFTG